MTTAGYAAFPWEQVPRMTRAEAQLATGLARWLAARPSSDRLSALLGGPVHARTTSPAPTFDPYAARCVLRARGLSIDVLAASAGVRAIAQQLLGGADELSAPRPLSAVEQSLWALVVATAVEDLAIEGEVWPMPAPAQFTSSPSLSAPSRYGLEVRAGGLVLAVELHVPGELVLRASPPRAVPRWAAHSWLEVPIVLGRCALDPADLARVRVRDLVTLEPASSSQPRRGRPAELDLLDGRVGVIVRRGPEPGSEEVVAEVVTGYVPRAVSVPDDARVELTVGLGTIQLSLRQIFDLAVGEVIPLGRPLAGPFELRAQGRVVGRGELVDVDGELAVRIVSLGD